MAKTLKRVRFTQNVDSRIWTDERFTQLEFSGLKLLALYVITSSQSNRIGLHRFSVAKAVEDLGAFMIAPEDFATKLVEWSERLDRVCDSLGWKFDGRVIFLPTYFKYHSLSAADFATIVESELHQLPESKLVDDFLDNETYLTSDCVDVLRAVKLRTPIAAVVEQPAKAKTLQLDALTIPEHWRVNGHKWSVATEQAWLAFLKSKRKAYQPTKRNITLLSKKLCECDSEETFVAALEEATLNRWATFYPRNHNNALNNAKRVRQPATDALQQFASDLDDEEGVIDG